MFKAKTHAELNISSCLKFLFCSRPFKQVKRCLCLTDTIAVLAL